MTHAPSAYPCGCWSRAGPYQGWGTLNGSTPTPTTASTVGVPSAPRRVPAKRQWHSCCCRCPGRCCRSCRRSCCHRGCRAAGGGPGGGVRWLGSESGGESELVRHSLGVFMGLCRHVLLQSIVLCCGALLPNALNI